MICLVKVGLFNGLRLAAKGDVVVQTLALAIALVNVIDAAELVQLVNTLSTSWTQARFG